MDRFIAWRGRGDDYPIHAAPAAIGFGGCYWIRAGGQHQSLDAGLRGQTSSGGVRVDSQNPASVRAQELTSQLTDQPEPDDHEGLTQSGSRQTDSLQCHGAEHGERGIVISYLGRNLGRQIGGDQHRFGVRAVGYHAVAGRKVIHSGSNLQHLAHVAVAQRDRFIELGAHRFQRGQQSIGLDLLPGLFHPVGLLARLVQQVGLAELEQHPLRSSRDQADRRTHQQMARGHPGTGNLLELDLPVGEIVQELFHPVIDSGSRRTMP